MTAKRKKKSSLNFFNKTVLFLNGVSALLLLLSYSASAIDPETLWPIAFIGLAYPFILLLNVGFVVYWLLQKPKFALLSLLTILLGWPMLTKNIGFRQSTADESPKSSANAIRVLTYNVHFFRSMEYQNDKSIKDKMLDVIQQEQPDVVCIQEFMTHERGEYNLIKSIKKILNTEHYYFVQTNNYPYEAQGLAIFSKYPIKKKGHIVFPNTPSGNEVIFADLKTGKKTFRIYNVHLQSIAFQPEDYKYLENVKSVSADMKSSRRIGSRLKRAFIKRGEQVKLLKEQTQDCKYPYAITGDFNDTPVSFAVNTMASGLNNAFVEKGSGFGKTYNGDFPNFQIDYILTSKDIDVKNYRIIKKKVSDHYAVRSDLELK